MARVWERGAGLTLACGSAACAILVAAARKGLAARTATVSLPGGDLALDWRDDDHVVMEGPVEWEFDTMLDAALFSDVAGVSALPRNQADGRRRELRLPGQSRRRRSACATPLWRKGAAISPSSTVAR